MQTIDPDKLLTQQILDDFAPVRARVMAAVAASPKSVTLQEALEQIEAFASCTHLVLSCKQP